MFLQGGVLIFSHFIFYFLIEKLLAHISHPLASERHPCHSGDGCDTTR